MTLYELLVISQNVNVEVNFYKNHEHYDKDKECELVHTESDSSNKLMIAHFRSKIPFDFKKCEVFYIGYLTTRSRFLKINVDVQEDK